MIIRPGIDPPGAISRAGGGSSTITAASGSGISGRGTARFRPGQPLIQERKPTRENRASTISPSSPRGISSSRLPHRPKEWRMARALNWPMMPPGPAGMGLAPSWNSSDRMVLTTTSMTMASTWSQ